MVGALQRKVNSDKLNSARHGQGCPLLYTRGRRPYSGPGNTPRDELDRNNISEVRDMGILVGLAVAAVLIIVMVISIYNGLVSLKLQAENAWADIDVQLKRRHDLIPNVVETVKGYAAHEKGTLESVIAARNRAMTAQGPAAQGEAEGALSGALRQLFALAEAYPQLRAVESFTALQKTLADLEETLQNARRYYNAVVRDFNTKIEQFPSNIIAGMFGFKEREFFELKDAGERETPKVSFDAKPA